MSLQEVLPVVRALSRGEKFRLIQVLATDLAEGELPNALSGLTCEVWSPCTDFQGAEKLMNSLTIQGKKA